MVEGHGVHRTAARNRAVLVGKTFTATSPNGRFTDGAAAIDGQPFQRVEAVGKNLFCFFGPLAGPLAVVHVHFGMAGVWAVFDSNREEVPPTTSTTRLCLEHADSGLVSHLSAMTVNLGDEKLFSTKKASLGEDPLRDDADAHVLFAKVNTSKRSIGALLMDQAFFCGPGNIYRAEILFKAGVHPNILGRDLGRERFDRVWYHTVDLLQRGFVQGSILTVDPAEAAALGNPRLRRYIYNSEKCGRCQGKVQSWDMSSRTCYACPACQPPPADGGDFGATKGISAAETPGDVKVFVSHCASESLSARLTQGAKKLLVSELKEELRARALSTSGKKADLVSRLDAAILLASGASGGGGVQAPVSAYVGSSKNLKDRKRFFLEEHQGPKKGIAYVDSYAAAAEKAGAGESRAVEHVAELHRSQATASGRKRAGGGGQKTAGDAGGGIEEALEARQVRPKGGSGKA